MVNTINYTHNLEKKGFSRQQAEAVVSTPYRFAKNRLATRQDMADLKQALVVLEHRMTIKMGLMMATAIGILLGLQRWPA